MNSFFTPVRLSTENRDKTPDQTSETQSEGSAQSDEKKIESPNLKNKQENSINLLDYAF
jgi:hypothetical protein